MEIIYRSESTGSEKKYICEGVSALTLRPVYERDLEKLKKAKPTLVGEELTLCNQLIESLSKSLREGIKENTNPDIMIILYTESETIKQGTVKPKTPREQFVYAFKKKLDLQTRRIRSLKKSGVTIIVG